MTFVDFDISTIFWTYDTIKLDNCTGHSFMASSAESKIKNEVNIQLKHCHVLVIS